MTDEWASIRPLRILCIGNGGIVNRQGQAWSHESIGTFLTELGRYVDQICFCAWWDPNDDPLAQTPLEGIRGVRVLGLRRVRGSILRTLVNGPPSFTALCREVARADFVYMYWPGRLSSVTARLCRALRKPYAIYLRGEEVDFDPSFVPTLRHARFVFSTGDGLRLVAKSHSEDVENVTPMTSVRADHIIAPREPRVSGAWQLLYVGRLEERKGIWELLRAASYLDKWDVPFVLTMVGHGFNKSELLGQCSPSVAARLRIDDPVADFDRLLSIYRAADVFVFPSHDEGFPRVVYEAMACGIPIVTTFVGSIPNVMHDGQNCLRVDARNAEDLADKIRQLLADPELQTRIAWGGHHTITALIKTWTRSHAMQLAERLRMYFTSTHQPRSIRPRRSV